MGTSSIHWWCRLAPEYQPHLLLLLLLTWLAWQCTILAQQVLQPHPVCLVSLGFLCAILVWPPWTCMTWMSTQNDGYCTASVQRCWAVSLPYVQKCRGFHDHLGWGGTSPATLQQWRSVRVLPLADQDHVSSAASSPDKKPASAAAVWVLPLYTSSDTAVQLEGSEDGSVTGAPCLASWSEDAYSPCLCTAAVRLGYVGPTSGMRSASSSQRSKDQVRVSALSTAHH